MKGKKPLVEDPLLVAHRKKAVKAAQELGYSSKVIERVKAAKTYQEITLAMKEGRAQL